MSGGVVPLTWPAPSTAGYTDWTIPATGGEQHLDPAVDYRILAPSKITGPVRLRGGRNVVWVGGHVELSGLNAPAEADSAGVSVENHPTLAPVAGRIVHVEGLRLDGLSLTQGVRWNAPSTIIQLANLHVARVTFKNCDHRDGTSGLPINHPDVLQGYGPAQEVRVDGLTGSSMYQGIFLNQTTVTTFPVKLRRVNLKAVEVAGVEQDGATGFSYAGHRMLTKIDEQTGPLHLDSGTVWVQHHPNAGWTDSGGFKKVRSLTTPPGYSPSVTRAGWNASAEGWTHSSGGALEFATANPAPQEGAGYVAHSTAFGSTFTQARILDVALQRDLSAAGTTLGCWCFVPADAPNVVWSGQLQVINAANTTIQGPDVTLTRGQWTFISWTPAAGVLTDVKRLAVRISATGANATVRVAFDTYTQGSDAPGAYTSEPVPGTSQFQNAVSTTTGTNTVASDAIGTYLTNSSAEVVGWDGTGSGRVYSGVPAKGDYVPVAKVGLGYADAGFAL